MTCKTPVIFLIFRRPDLTARVFEVIRQAQPTKLLIIADGSRNEIEEKLCQQARKVTEQVDWNCEVLTHYSETNLGCKQRVISGLDWAFEQVEEAIILEDDTLPDLSFFEFASDLLEYYRHNPKIMAIGGTNILDVWQDKKQSYHFSYQGSIWGWATWKRAWQLYDVEMKDWKKEKVKHTIRKLSLKDRYYQSRKTLFEKISLNEINTWDYQWLFARLARSGLTVIPSKNLVSNLGFRDDATHTVNESSRFSNLRRHSIAKKLKHPKVIAIDTKYEQKVLKTLFDRPITVSSGISLKSLWNQAKIKILKKIRSNKMKASTEESKVGILTFHDGINHGGFLQAYCLQEVLKKEGKQVKIINYKSAEHRTKERKVFLGNSIKSYLRPKQLKRIILNLFKIIKFKNNQKLLESTKYSQEVSSIIKSESFDTVILGSDEIWNFKNPLVGLDLTYFGKDIKANKIISYAPSFGQVSTDELIDRDIIDCLQNLSSVSARDSNSIQILNSLSITAQKVLDPTFLHEITLPEKKLNTDKYILIYLTGVTPSKDVEYLRQYARANNKKLLAISYPQSWCDRSFVNVGIFEWLRFFKDADAVITNTFHGSIYSILYKKNFCVFRSEYKANKINSLLQDLSLLEFKVDNVRDVIQRLSNPPDYFKVFEKISDYREQSLNYLRYSLNESTVNVEKNLL